MRTLNTKLSLLAALLLLAAQAHAQEVIAVRYYMAEILAPTEEKPFYRVSIADAVPGAEAWHTDIPTDPQTGIPLFTHALVNVEAKDWSGIAADARNIRIDGGAVADQSTTRDLLTQFSVKRWNDLSGAQRTKLRDTMRALGVPTADLDTNVSLRAVLQKIGRYLNPTFDETKLGIHQ